MEHSYNTEIKELLVTAIKQVENVQESINKLLDQDRQTPNMVNGSTFQSPTSPRIEKAKRIAEGWQTLCNHKAADFISSYALAEITEVSQPWCLHMLKCRKALIEQGKDPKTVPWSKARTVVNR